MESERASKDIKKTEDAANLGTCVGKRGTRTPAQNDVIAPQAKGVNTLL